MANMDIWNSQDWLPRVSGRLLSEALLEDLNYKLSLLLPHLRPAGLYLQK